MRYSKVNLVNSCKSAGIYKTPADQWEFGFLKSVPFLHMQGDIDKQESTAITQLFCCC